jgi:hypothetical protein
MDKAYEMPHESTWRNGKELWFHKQAPCLNRLRKYQVASNMTMEYETVQKHMRLRKYQVVGKHKEDQV